MGFIDYYNYFLYINMGLRVSEMSAFLTSFGRDRFSGKLFSFSHSKNESDYRGF